MKRLFTFLTVALLAFTGGLTANAQQEEDITSKFTGCWGGADESVTANEDGSLTYNSKAWGGLSAWIGGADWSAYASITFEFSEPTPSSGQIQLQRDGLDALTQWYNAGSNSVTLKFEGNDVTKVNQVALQASAVGTFQISRVYLTVAVVYEDTPAASLEVNGEKQQLFPASLFAGYTENAKVVFTVEIAGSANYGGWGIGEITTPTVTKNEDWSLKDGIIVLTVSGGTDGVFTYQFKMKELMPALTSWPDADGNYGLVSNMYGQNQPDRGECTVSLKSVEIFEAVDAEATDITVDVAEGEDISAAVTAASLGKKVGNININLADGATCTVSSTLVAPNILNIEGNWATIDASALEGPFITLNGTDKFVQKNDGTESDHKYIDYVSIDNVDIIGLKDALVKDNQKTYVEYLSIIGSNIEMPAAGKNVLDFNGKGYVGKVLVGNSTIWAKDMNTGFFAQYGSRPKNIDENWTQVFDFENSTIVNIANGKNLCDLKQNGTAQNEYIVKNSIFVDCGKSGQTIVGMNKGQTSATPVWDVIGNYFEWGGECKNAAEVEKTGQKDGENIVKDCIEGKLTFTDAANGNFNGTFDLAEGAVAPLVLGDPQWYIEFVTAETPISEGHVLYALVEGDTFASGQTVEVLYDETGAKAGAVVATITYGEALADAEAPAFNAAAADAHVEGYTAFTAGNGVNGNKPGGTFYTIVPKYDGVISAAIVLNNGKAFHLTVDGVQNETFDGNTVSNKYYGTFEFNVAAGKAYKFYCDGSKLGFYGFNYVWGPEVEPITELPLNDETVGIATVNTAKQQDVYYNLQGVRVAQPTKGLYIINGKKVVVK